MEVSRTTKHQGINVLAKGGEIQICEPDIAFSALPKQLTLKFVQTLFSHITLTTEYAHGLQVFTHKGKTRRMSHCRYSMLKLSPILSWKLAISEQWQLSAENTT